jgi:hypothetical protein
VEVQAILQVIFLAVHLLLVVLLGAACQTRGLQRAQQQKRLEAIQ